MLPNPDNICTPSAKQARPKVVQPIVLLAGGAMLLLAAFVLNAIHTPLRASTEGSGTTIVVDTSADLNPGSNTQTCTYSSGALFVPAADGCTLRRALREAAGPPKRSPHPH